jgi:hypothetical protein
MKNLFIPAVLVFFLGFFGCKDQGVDVDDREIPDQNVSFSEHIQPVFEFHCTPCHNEQTREAGLSLTTWSSTVADPSIVFPEDPEASRLVWAIEGRPGAYFMPPIGSPYRPLNQNQIKGVYTWIKEGARNN